MKRILATTMALSLLALPALATFPTHSNLVTADVSKVTGNYDGFSMKWAGYESQSITFSVHNGTTQGTITTNTWVSTNGSFVVTNSVVTTNTVKNWLDLDGYSAAFKVCRQSNTGQVCYVSKSADDCTVSDSNVTITVVYSNVPPNRQYQAELWLYEGTATTTTRTVSQGGVTVYDSLFGDNDSNFPFPYQTNLTDYALSSYVQTVAAQTTNYITVVAGQTTNKIASSATAVSNYVNTVAGQTTNYVQTVAGQTTNYVGVVAAQTTNHVASSAGTVSNYVNTVAGQTTNYVGVVAAQTTNYIGVVALQTTNQIWASALASTNYTLAAALAATNYTQAAALAATNYTLAAALAATNYTQAAATAATNFTLATSALLSNSFLRVDGGNAMAADIPMGGNNITNAHGIYWDTSAGTGWHMEQNRIEMRGYTLSLSNTLTHGTIITGSSVYAASVIATQYLGYKVGDITNAATDGYVLGVYVSGATTNYYWTYRTTSADATTVSNYIGTVAGQTTNYIDTVAADNTNAFVQKVASCDCDVFLYHEAPADADDVIVCADFGEYNATNAYLAFGAFSASNTLQSLDRGGVITVPLGITAITNIMLQVYGTTVSAVTNKVDVRLYDPSGTNTINYTGFVTDTVNGWKWLSIPASNKWINSTSYAGKGIRVKVREYAGWGTTTAVERVWRVQQ